MSLTGQMGGGAFFTNIMSLTGQRVGGVFSTNMTSLTGQKRNKEIIANIKQEIEQLK